jgi:hypothetical protein
MPCPTLGLGRAYAMAGNKPDAKKAYDVFFSEWKNADSDLPVIAEAKRNTRSCKDMDSRGQSLISPCSCNPNARAVYHRDRPPERAAFPG